RVAERLRERSVVSCVSAIHGHRAASPSVETLPEMPNASRFNIQTNGDIWVKQHRRYTVGNEPYPIPRELRREVSEARYAHRYRICCDCSDGSHRQVRQGNHINNY